MLISQQAAITALQAQVAAIKPVDPAALNTAVAAAVAANPPVVDVAAIADAVEARTKAQYDK
jgi:ABC-type sugar transport system substrate-binding protein